MGREWNDKLVRRLQDSIVRANRSYTNLKLLVTDLEDSDQTLVEVVGEYPTYDDAEQPVGTAWQVIGQYIVRPQNRPKTLRYRDERGWPE